MWKSGADHLETPGGKEREDALAALGKAVAIRPWNLDEVEAACRGIRDVAPEDIGDGLILEACLTAANFENVTKLVDATIRKSSASWYSTYVMDAVMKIGSVIRYLLPSFLTG